MCPPTRTRSKRFSAGSNRSPVSPSQKSPAHVAPRTVMRSPGDAVAALGRDAHNMGVAFQLYVKLQYRCALDRVQCRDAVFHEPIMLPPVPSTEMATSCRPESHPPSPPGTFRRLPHQDAQAQTRERACVRHTSRTDDDSTRWMSHAIRRLSDVASCSGSGDSGSKLVPWRETMAYLQGCLLWGRCDRHMVPQEPRRVRKTISRSQGEPSTAAANPRGARKGSRIKFGCCRP